MATTSGSGDEPPSETTPLLQPPEPQTSTSTQPQIQPKKHSPLIRQVFFGFVVALPSVAPGMSLGFSAVSLDQLRLDLDDASWFASVTAMAFPVGSLIVGPLMDRFGRRPALLAINIVSLVGWLMLSVHTARPTMFKLIAGRILTGIACGLASIPAAVYAAESLSPNDFSMRSALVTWSTVALGGGVFLVYSTGSFLPYYAVASIATLVSIIAFILVAIFLSESPIWLASKGRHSDAEWAQREINIMPPPPPTEQPSEVEDNRNTPPPVPLPVVHSPRTLDELAKPEAYKPLLIMTGFLFFQQFSGVYVMIAYMVDIIRTAGVITINPYAVTVIGGTIILLVSLTASLIYPKTGVRSVAALSGAGTAATMLFIGSFLSLRHYWVTEPELYFLNWVPFFAILTNIAISSVGFFILPWSMLGEVFPLHVKGIAAGITTCLGFIFSFMAAKLYPYILISLGASGVFFFFGFMALLGTIFVILFLPETKGKTLQEILDSFSNRQETR